MIEKEEVFSSGVVFEQLADNIFEWASARGITPETGGTVQGQLDKLLEEAQEVSDAVKSANRKHIQLEIGDVQVVLLMLCRHLGLNLVDCLNQTFNKISKRTGHTEGGVFVKDEE